MRAKPIPSDVQYQRILECRSSGMSDYQWCLEHDIKPGTFYNWVKRLRQKGTVEVPQATSPSNHSPLQPDVVQVSLHKPAVAEIVG